MENGAKGVEVVVAGKLRGQRAKAMKFREGYMVKSGQGAIEYNDYATRHIMMRQGIMGCRVKIMQPHDPKGIDGVKAKMCGGARGRDGGRRRGAARPRREARSTVPAEWHESASFGTRVPNPLPHPAFPSPLRRPDVVTVLVPKE